MALSVLVVIEMLNALNALSEDGSLVQVRVSCPPSPYVELFESYTGPCTCKANSVIRPRRGCHRCRLGATRGSS
jgi:hypothetical protein